MVKNDLSIRITTGTAKNRKLKAPDIPGFRAVQEVAKMSLFSMLGEKVIGARCLDLYSGSGNLGIEALSRGVEWCDFIDENIKSVKTININLKNCGLTEKAEVIQTDAAKYAANTMNKYDIIFVDPFYAETSHIFLTKNLEDILEQNGIIAFFHGDNLDINDLIKDTGLKIADERKFGRSFFTILARQ